MWIAPPWIDPCQRACPVLPQQSWCMTDPPLPEPGSAAEREAFAGLQGRLRGLFERIFPDRIAPRSIVVLPSLTLDQDVIAKVTGVHHYEERMLGMLMLLRLPRTRVIYLTSQPIPETDRRLLPASAARRASGTCEGPSDAAALF